MLDLRAMVLLPPEDLGREIIALSQALNASGESPIELSDNRLPHLTVVQTDAPLDSLHRITQQIQNHWSDKDILTLAGFCFVPEETRIWLEVPALKSSNLSALQNKSAEELKANDFQVLSGVDDAYRPHLTVALIKTVTSTIPPLDHKSLRASVGGWKLAVSELGENYVVGKENVVTV